MDAGYDTFPKPEWLAGMAEQVPDGFRFAFKVTDDITIRRFPNLPRFGPALACRAIPSQGQREQIDAVPDNRNVASVRASVKSPACQTSPSC